MAIAPTRATGTGLRPRRMAGTTKPTITANEQASPISERTLPAAEGDHGQDEQRGQGQHRPSPLQVADVVEGRLAGLLQDGQPDPLARRKSVAGRVGGLELDLLAPGVRPCPHLDAGRPGQARLGLLARHRLDAGQGGRRSRVGSAWPPPAGSASRPPGQAPPRRPARPAPARRPRPAAAAGGFRSRPREDAMPRRAAPPATRCACRGSLGRLQTGYRCNELATDAAGAGEEGGCTRSSASSTPRRRWPPEWWPPAESGSACAVPPRRSRSARPPGRAGRRLHLRRADAELPGGRRDQRPPARRRPGRCAGRGPGPAASVWPWS